MNCIDDVMAAGRTGTPGRRTWSCLATVLLALGAIPSPVVAQTLDDDLRQMPARELVSLAKSDGDAVRGAIVFLQPHMACAKCHAVTEPLDPATLDAKNLRIKTWSLKRTADYGSKHYDENPLAVRAATLSADSKTLTLDVADLHPTCCIEIRYSLRSAIGTPILGTIHNTIHELAD